MAHLHARVARDWDWAREIGGAASAESARPLPGLSSAVQSPPGLRSTPLVRVGVARPQKEGGNWLTIEVLRPSSSSSSSSEAAAMMAAAMAAFEASSGNKAKGVSPAASSSAKVAAPKAGGALKLRIDTLGSGVLLTVREA